jgi:beta-N-acetylhexosaminidase
MSRRVILRRRLIAVASAIGATVLIWVLLLASDDAPEQAEAPVELEAISAEARRILGTMSDEEKVDQVILAGVGRGDTPGTGAVVIDAADWPGLDRGRRMIRQLAKEGPGPLPPLIATRQEGGPYRELADLPPEPRPIEIGDAGDRDKARRWAEQTASRLDSAGFNLNLAPVADVASLDSPIADRSFSDDPAVAAALAASAARGCREGGIACAPSHFPGLGAATQDPGAGPASVAVDRETLISRDVAPFRAAFARGAPAVVVSNAFYSAYDPVTPASLSPEILGGLLREETGFEGVAITADLEEGAIRAGYDVPDAARTAISAGADMVQISDPEDVEDARAELLAAVASGALAANRLDGAAGRVIDLKLDLGLRS